MAAYGLAGPIEAFAAGGGAMWGTCAGRDHGGARHRRGAPPSSAVMDIIAHRNAFGRQVRSFEADLEVEGVDGGPVHAVFIRAPWSSSAGPGVDRARRL